MKKSMFCLRQEVEFISSMKHPRGGGVFTVGLFVVGAYLSLVLILLCLSGGVVISGYLILPFYLLVVWGILRVVMLLYNILWKCRFDGDSSPKRVFWFSFLSSLIVLTVVWLNCFGFHSPDTEEQWRQACLFQFHDWHPVAHTFLIAVAAAVVKQYSFVVYVQIVVLSASIGFLARTLSEIKLRAGLICAVVGFIVLNPEVWVLSEVLWKDVAFAIAVLWVAIFSIHILASQGMWMDKKRNILTLSVALACSLIMRHNGVFFCVPFLMFLFFAYPGHLKPLSCVVLLVLLVYAGIRYGLYCMLDVDDSPRFAVSQTYTESIGGMISMMGDAYYFEKEKLSPEAVDLMQKIATPDEWGDFYQPGYMNSLRYRDPGKYARAFTDIAPVEFMTLWATTTMAAPVSAFRGAMNRTSLVWHPWRKIYQIKLPETQHAFLARELNAYKTMVHRFQGGGVFYSIGLFNIVFLFVALIGSGIIGWRSVFMCVPPWCYNLLTILMLYGDSWRVFFFNCLIVLPVTLVVLKEIQPQLKRLRKELHVEIP